MLTEGNGPARSIGRLLAVLTLPWPAVVLACGGLRSLRDGTEEDIAATALWFVAFLVGLGLAYAARIMAQGGAAGRVAFVSYWVNALAAGAAAAWIVYREVAP
ncbi:MAG: hypothetical protein ACYS99_19650 [Planctomycetota bacterium]